MLRPGPSASCPACPRALSGPPLPCPRRREPTPTQEQTPHLQTLRKHPGCVGWQRPRAEEGLSPKCCVSSFYLGPGRAQARGAGTSVGAQEPFKVPWAPPPPPMKTGAGTQTVGCPTLPPTHAGLTPEDSRSQEVWGAVSPSRGFLPALWPQPAFRASEARPPPSLGQLSPELPLANRFLGLSSVLCPN